MIFLIPRSLYLSKDELDSSEHNEGSRPSEEVEALADEQDGLLPKEECLASARDILRGRVPG